jgi:hypothetical protein
MDRQVGLGEFEAIRQVCSLKVMDERKMLGEYNRSMTLSLAPSLFSMVKVLTLIAVDVMLPENSITAALPFTSADALDTPMSAISTFEFETGFGNLRNMAPPEPRVDALLNELFVMTKFEESNASVAK